MVFQRESIQAELSVPHDPTCRHHWMIEPATGPLSQGVCQFCQETREFKNFIENTEEPRDERPSDHANAVHPASEPYGITNISTISAR